MTSGARRARLPRLDDAKQEYLGVLWSCGFLASRRSRGRFLLRL